MADNFEEGGFLREIAQDADSNYDPDDDPDFDHEAMHSMDENDYTDDENDSDSDEDQPVEPNRVDLNDTATSADFAGFEDNDYVDMPDNFGRNEVQNWLVGM